MSLIIAQVEGPLIWMVGDTALTEGKIGQRDREYLPKIEVGRVFPALVGFAGGAEYGAKQAREAAMVGSSTEALKLLAASSTDAEVQFAYGVIEEKTPRLYRIEGGEVVECSVLHLGSTEAFSIFQRIRHGEVDPYAPKAFKNFLSGGPTQAPQGLSDAIHSMIDLFAARAEHDVGGWAVPYILSAEGVSFCSYCYSVSDPVFDQLAPGSVVGHGTAEWAAQAYQLVSWPITKEWSSIGSNSRAVSCFCERLLAMRSTSFEEHPPHLSPPSALLSGEKWTCGLVISRWACRAV